MVTDISSMERPVGMDPTRFGRQSFLLRPGSFSVIDGDTIWVLPNPKPDNSGRKSRPAFSMRFRSIAAPEKPKASGIDWVLQSSGLNPHWDSPGQEATDLLKKYLDRRALLVQPSGEVDKYKRMLCDMSVVSYSDNEPDLKTAVSLECLMLENGVVSPFEGEAPPPLRSRNLDPDMV